MNTDERIAFVAIVLGLTQLVMLAKKIHEAEDISYYSVEYIVVGMLVSLLWVIYQYRKGSNFSVIYSSSGLFLGMYTLKKLLKNKNDKKIE